MNFFVFGAADDIDALLKAQKEARRKLYESAARKCAVLRAPIASNCQLSANNFNISRSYGRQRGDCFNVSGNFNFRVTLN